jgi:hypothetical protein
MPPTRSKRRADWTRLRNTLAGLAALACADGVAAQVTPLATPAPLGSAIRITPTSASREHGAFRLHRLTGPPGSIQSVHGAWRLDNSESEIAFAIRVAPGARYRLTCEYSLGHPEVWIVDGSINDGSIDESEFERSSGVSLTGDRPPSPSPDLREARVRTTYVWRRVQGGRRLLTATLESVPYNVWREVIVTARNDRVAVYTCEAVRR